MSKIIINLHDHFSLIQDGNLLSVPIHSSVSHSHSDGSPSRPEIETHKQRIARAVDSVREKRQQYHQQQSLERKEKTKTTRTASKEVTIEVLIMKFIE